MHLMVTCHIFMKPASLCVCAPPLLPLCRDNGVDVVTLGQYQRPTKRHMAVAEYVTPQAFAAYQKVGSAAHNWLSVVCSSGW